MPQLGGYCNGIERTAQLVCALCCVFTFWNQVITAQNAGVWQRILQNAHELTSPVSWGAHVQAFCGNYGIQMPDLVFAHPVHIGDVPVATLAKYNRMFK